MGFHSNSPVLAFIPTLSVTSKAPFDRLAPTPIHNLLVDLFRSDKLSAKGLDEGKKSMLGRKKNNMMKGENTHTKK